MLNSASAAAFISGRSVGAARRGLPGAAARKEKNGLRRAPLLKSPHGRRRGGRRGARMGGGGARGGRAGSRDAARVAAAEATALVVWMDSRAACSPQLAFPPPPLLLLLLQGGARGGARPRVRSAPGGGVGRGGREARALCGDAHPGQPQLVTPAPASVSFPRPAGRGGGKDGVEGRGLRGRSQSRYSRKEAVSLPRGHLPVLPSPSFQKSRHPTGGRAALLSLGSLQAVAHLCLWPGWKVEPFAYNPLSPPDLFQPAHGL